MPRLDVASAIRVGGGSSATWGDVSTTWGDASTTWGAGASQAADRVYLGSTLAYPAASYVIEPYGTAYTLDALQNVIVGSSLARQCSQRFRAQKSGSIATVTTWLKNYSGYGLGDGGTIQAAIQTDNGSGLPSGTTLGYKTRQGPAFNSNNLAATWTFDSPVSVTADTLYHVVYTNVAADPTANYCSVNNTITYNAYDPYQPRADWDDNSFTTLAKSGTGSWARYYNSTPILDVGFTDDTHYGNSIYDYRYGVVFSGTTMLRERFTVSGADRLVGGIALRFAKTVANTGSADVTARLEQSDGTLIESVTLDTSSVNTADHTANWVNAGTWASGAFTGNRTLTSGTTYNVRFDVSANTELWSRPIKWTTAYSSDTAWTDGYGQYSTNAGSSWAYLPGLGNTANLQFYMTPGT